MSLGCCYDYTLVLLYYTIPGIQLSSARPRIVRSRPRGRYVPYPSAPRWVTVTVTIWLSQDRYRSRSRASPAHSTLYICSPPNRPRGTRRSCHWSKNLFVFGFIPPHSAPSILSVFGFCCFGSVRSARIVALIIYSLQVKSKINTVFFFYQQSFF